MTGGRARDWYQAIVVDPTFTVSQTVFYIVCAFAIGVSVVLLAIVRQVQP